MISNSGARRNSHHMHFVCSHGNSMFVVPIYYICTKIVNDSTSCYCNRIGLNGQTQIMVGAIATRIHIVKAKQSQIIGPIKEDRGRTANHKGMRWCEKISLTTSPG